MSAPIYPPPANQALWIHNRERLRQAYDDDLRFQLDDWTNTNPARGPVQGYPAGGFRAGILPRRGR